MQFDYTSTLPMKRIAAGALFLSISVLWLMRHSLGRPIVIWRNALPRPVAREVVDDLRREFGDCALRLVWDIGQGSSVFQVLVGHTVRAYVKLAKNLAAEAQRLQWLERRIPAPRVVSIGTCESTDWLVTTPLSGLALSDLKHTEPPARITRQLAEAIQLVHNTPANDCPFGEPSPTSVLVHGDACLPNFLFTSGTLTGLVDLGQCGLGDPLSDLATAVWSVQYNLGPGHAKGFLDAYGIDLEANNLELTLDEDGNETLRLVAGHTTA